MSGHREGLCAAQACGLYPMLGTVSEKAGGGAAMVIKTRENAKVAPAASSVNYSDSKAAVQARIKHRFEAPPCLLLAFDEVTRGALPLVLFFRASCCLQWLLSVL